MAEVTLDFRSADICPITKKGLITESYGELQTHQPDIRPRKSPQVYYQGQGI